MHPLDSAFVTVIVIALVAYAVWATFRIDAQSATIANLRELLRMIKQDGGCDD